MNESTNFEFEGTLKANQMQLLDSLSKQIEILLGEISPNIINVYCFVKIINILVFATNRKTIIKIAMCFNFTIYTIFQ